MLKFLEIARQNILRQGRGNIFLVVLIAMAVVSCLFLFVPDRPERVRGDYLFAGLTIVGGLTLFHPLATMFFAIQVSHGDLADRTSTFLFTRPIPRPVLLLGKWLSAVVLGSIVLVVGLSCLYGVFVFGGREWKLDKLPQIEWYQSFLISGLMSTAGYAAMGVLLGVLVRRPVIWATIFLVGWEAVLSRVAANAGVVALSVNVPMRRWIAIDLDVGRRQPLGRMLIDRPAQLSPDEAPLEGADLMMLGDPRITLLKFTLVCLAGAILIYWWREDQARTPE